MGFIYIIKNNINSKVYVGQTGRTVEERYEEHLRDAKKKNIKTKIYSAIRELGAHNLYVETLIECDEFELNEFEQYFVTLYDSLNSGYNSVYPCSSGGIRPVHDYEDKVADMYLRGNSYAYIAQVCNISLAEVGRIITDRDIDTQNRDYVRQSTNKAVKMVMYDLKFNPIGTFDRILDAYYYIQKERNNMKNFALTFYSRVKVACENGNVSYNHRWQKYSDLIYEDKIFRTKFDKEAYINGGEAYQPEGKTYWVVESALDSILKHYYKGKGQNKCRVCGKSIDKDAIKCRECHNKELKINTKSPDKDTLEKLLKTTSYVKIGEMYGVSGNAVKKWAIKYNLENIRGYKK